MPEQLNEGHAADATESAASAPVEGGDIDLSAFATNLVRDAVGTWRPCLLHSETVSFPSTAHAQCYPIEADSFWYEHRSRCLRELIAKSGTQGPLFDIGGGNGGVAQALARDGIEVCVVEPGETAVANARKRGVRNIVCATFDAVRFRPASLPAVGLFDVLEHIADDQGLLGQVRRAMRSKARLFVTVPAHSWLWSPFDAAVGHYRRYARVGLEDLLAAAGFSVVRSSYWFFPLVLPIFTMRTLPGWLGIATGVGAEGKRLHHGARARGLVSRSAIACARALLGAEFDYLRRGRGIPWGASCFCVAEVP
jgi:SAM-dependent methyltransferase